MQNILIVEDDARLREMYRTALRAAGYVVQEAADGFAALRSLDADPPDLVVLDLLLPRLDGYAVRQELKSQVHTRQIPIVVVTGAFGAHDNLDVNCLLRKPVAPDDLVATVQKCLAAGV
jgi:twitching motility two-component system response regulator PilH